MGLEFTTIPSNFDEYLDDTQPATQIAQELALGKAQEIAKLHPDALVIGSDVIVTVGNRQLAKAADEAEARAMLELVISQPNRVTAGVAIVCLEDHIQEVGYEDTWVYFKPYDKIRTEEYIRTGDWKDKAGAYGIQSGAAPLVDYIRGNADTVMGLPTNLVAHMLEKVGISAHPVDVVLPIKMIAI